MERILTANEIKVVEMLRKIKERSGDTGRFGYVSTDFLQMHFNDMKDLKGILYHFNKMGYTHTTRVLNQDDVFTTMVKLFEDNIENELLFRYPEEETN